MPRLLRSQARLLAALVVGTLACDATAGEAGTAPHLGRADFVDRRDPPAWRNLAPERRAAVDLGLQVFNTTWVVAGTPDAERRDGLGPLFVSASCDGCHNNGARGRPPATPGALSNSFVMQLDDAGDTYGAVLSTSALPGHAPEGQVEVSWIEHSGRYQDGNRWTLREPRYELRSLNYGPLPDTTVLRPRIAPAVYGTGLLGAVPAQALWDVQSRQASSLRGREPSGRLGWQAQARDVEDQTAKAFAREMGLTSRLQPADDCTAVQIACRASPAGGPIEVSDELLQGVVAFQQEVAVPARQPLQGDREISGSQLFNAIGCAACHVPSLPVVLGDQEGRINPYTDLLLHDLGDGLADRRIDGRPVRSRWRTAPLWGLSHAVRDQPAALLHDGRADSIEAAVLWHEGEASAARRAFAALAANQRRLLLDWVGSL